ncbi:MAG: FlgO family outer membrane protein [Gemmatimonadota bacterium]|nr:FlgO family outer membrane protein [Gemmatimonadota bacterium]
MFRSLTPPILAVLALSAAGPRAVSAQAPEDVPTVAVLDFTGFMMGEAGNSVNLGKAVSAMLITEFSERPGMRVIERARLQDLLTEQKLALSGRIAEGSAVEVGQMLGAQYVLHGQVTNIADRLRLDIRAVDVETSEVVSVMKKMDGTSELLAVIVAVADEFAEALSLTPPSARPAPEPIPVRATIEFSRAVDLEDRGQIEDAINHYEAALEIHPGHRDARAALRRLRPGGGL